MVIDCSEMICRDTVTVSEAMRRINTNTYGIVFLTDNSNKLSGCITDGDIRRFILAGGKLTDNVIDAAEHHPRYARSIEEAKNLYHKKNYVVIPILNYDGVIIDLYYGDGDIQKKLYRSLKVPVVINAGGKGTRLDPFTRVLPKPLIPIGEVPIIELIMKEYQSYDCSEFHVIVNYKRDLLKTYFLDSDNQYNIIWYDEEKPLGTGGGLSLLKGKISSTFILSNCDTLLTANYGDIVDFHKKSKNSITMVCAYKSISIPYGVVETGINGIINRLNEKPTMSFLVNTGIYIVEPDVLNDIVDDELIGFPDIVEREKAKGKKVAAFPISENDWMDMGQLPELEKMRIKLRGEVCETDNG